MKSILGKVSSKSIFTCVKILLKNILKIQDKDTFKKFLKIQDKILSCILKIQDTILKIVSCTTLGLATSWTYFLYLSLSFIILIDSCMGSPVRVLMLSIQAVRGHSRLRAPGIVPCVISFSKQLPCFLMLWPYSMLASLLWQCLTVPSLLQLC